ncbi:uncharacterized protein PADG_04549 [Paracoccidioides brasiliensis Pb18]|uniref:Small EDRK-rich factor-like N-terminal domain-containing protein n=1 Tax=Paracoccidioides brasiliensis (strain Pb18) TaxID=502780 RepID=C1GC27_PARBD|nr:uncharacterized protein PADG_04549 [Paracoccidioides brasiliensis Pb18]EEH48470.2 hypothetical protein PADG_04549 [Paracoccidioides brasiliensis Pb18]
MARGNQREKAREKTQKEAAQQKKKNTQSGTEFARTKEAQAAIMRQKQEAGMSPSIPTCLLKHAIYQIDPISNHVLYPDYHYNLPLFVPLSILY